jgi:hypothetical protein
MNLTLIYVTTYFSIKREESSIFYFQYFSAELILNSSGNYMHHML